MYENLYNINIGEWIIKEMETIRIQKLVKLAKSAPYTKKELKLLYNLIKSKMDTSYTLDTNLFDISESLKGEMKGKGTLIDWNSDSEEYASFKNLNFLQFLLVYFKKIFIFLVCVPLERVPIYIGHNQLNDFATWRLLINK